MPANVQQTACNRRPTPDGYSNLIDSWSVGLMQGTPFDADPPNTDIHTNITTRRVRWTLLHECEVSEQTERFIRALLASSLSECMSLSVLYHPWLVTEAELEGAPQPMTPPALHAASLQSLPSAPSIADGAPAAKLEHTPPPAAPLMGLPGTASLLRMDGEQRSAAGSHMSLDAPSLILADDHVLSGTRSATSEGSQRGKLQWRSEVLSRGQRVCEELPAPSQDTLEDDTRVGRSRMRRGVKRKSLPEESDDEGFGYAAPLPPQTQEQDDPEEESRVAKRLRTELSMSVADVDGAD
ncbi:uncharacterized protein BXZ73DRAFT_109124 [Epithele typhae]|uniref:uncharacterized protein n=1 Tax=Epithele typhae TaxID=378194 RepID=UPI002008B012|nr:uncharacterized protein BXZ73DRAFT_109124 [Epithele typhae]KAH9910361.1 hypothetical protein BXZ73DRAFT_109124 [Epithele typhae]